MTTSQFAKLGNYIKVGPNQEIADIDVDFAYCFWEKDEEKEIY